MLDERLKYYFGAPEMADMMADTIEESLNHALEREDEVLLVLPGGSSPRQLMVDLARRELPWERIQITTTDERRVAEDSEFSNIGQVKDLMDTAKAQFFPLWNNSDAALNDEILMACEEQGPATLAWPAAVTVIGMGADGHIASLFPGDEPAHSGYYLSEGTAPSDPKERISLRLRILLKSERLILMVSDKEKLDICERILGGEDLKLPVADLINQAGKKLEIHVLRKMEDEEGYEEGYGAIVEDDIAEDETEEE